MLFEAVDLLAGGALLFGGWLMGRFTRKSRKPYDGDIPPICGCEHHFSFHGEDGGSCDWVRYFGAAIYERCHCKKYSGPLPLESYTAGT